MVVPWVCHICRRGFETPDGGICMKCRNPTCGSHLDSSICVQCSINFAFHQSIPIRAPALICINPDESTWSIKDNAESGGYHGWAVSRPSQDLLVVSRRRRFPGIRLVNIEFTFNRLMGEILRNQERLVGFDEIDHLQLKTTSHSDIYHDRLTAILRTGAKIIEVDYSDDMWPTVALAKIVGGILGVRTVWEVG